MFRLAKKIGQSTAEYAIILALVIGAVTAMQIYIKRGMQGKIKDVVDYKGVVDQDLGNEKFSFTSEQYEPGQTSSKSASKRTGTGTEELVEGGSRITGSEDTSRYRQLQKTGWGKQTVDEEMEVPEEKEGDE
ncbi:MAG: hypothetical protein QMD94_00680 [Candidatus Omnitrophota bacterium]|nr:hypothetical protein [Candidatus Omnitrophota bacterium]